MTFRITLSEAQELIPEYKFLNALSPSAQKAAFHVQDPSSGIELCVKIISPDYEPVRLQREILAMQQIDNKNVAKLKQYEFSTKEGHSRHFLVEEFVNGEDLEDFIQRSTDLSRETVADLFAQICDGLEALRINNIVHRDLKPRNIRVKPNNSPVIIDFGLARHLSLPDATRTSEGAAIGTPLYFAPEQWKGDKHDIDHRTDLFALGIMLYEALVREHPFMPVAVAKGISLSDAICFTEDFLSHKQFLALPDSWKIILSRLLKKERSHRPKSASQVASIFRKIRSL